MTTISTLVSYPVGVRALLVAEAAIRRRMEGRVVETLESAEYAEIILPIVDFVDPYSPALREKSLRQAYRFTDREGELIAIRADFTPMVARALAPVIDPRELPLRIFYRGDVIRCERSRLGASREFFQIGAELVGDPSVDADAEVVRLAAESVRACGIEPVVAIVDTSIARDLIEQVAPAPADRPSLLEALAQRRPAALRSCDGKAGALLARMAEGDISLDELKEFEPTRAAAERLGTIEGRLQEAGIRAILNLDEVEVDAGYYTGISFRVFVEDRNAPVASGGRYDGLYRDFGRDVPAVGFTLSLDYLEER
ncbi:MAG: ATP phosphoribosyltransferase regulatory subunit [Thermoanaerobaculia bacterium]